MTSYTVLDSLSYFDPLFNADEEKKKLFIEQLSRIPLNNPALKGIVPYDANLSQEVKNAVIEECQENLFYFIFISQENFLFESHEEMKPVREKVAAFFRANMSVGFVAAFSNFLNSGDVGLLNCFLNNQPNTAK